MSRERERTSSMVASYSSAPPSSWRPAVRSLGALFAGSAVMFASTVVNGDSLLLAGDQAGSITRPHTSPTGIGPSPSGSVSAPAEHTVGMRGAAPQRHSAQWGSSPGDLPVGRAPVQGPQQQGAPTPAATAEVAYEGSAASGSSVAPTVASGQPADDSGFGRSSSQTADPRHGKLFDGLLNSVFHVAKALSH